MQSREASAIAGIFCRKGLWIIGTDNNWFCADRSQRRCEVPPGRRHLQ